MAVGWGPKGRWFKSSRPDIPRAPQNAAFRVDESTTNDVVGWRAELLRLDTAVYSAIAGTPTPVLDRILRGVSRAADHSKLWLASAGLLTLAGGPRGRRAAVDGLASVGLTSAVVNGIVKPLAGRRRPDRATHRVPVGRQVKMPVTHSFPSGHAASAFAFAAGVAAEAPQAGVALNVAAAVVAYSRVHTGVHYPGDVLVGSLTGGALAPIAVTLVRRRRAAA
jgi:membrane-associated phospholipid phosphatase